MTEHEKYLYSEYGKNHEEIMRGVTHSASEAYSRINIALGEKYTDVMSELEAHHDDKVFQGYIRGYKDGIRHILNMATS